MKSGNLAVKERAKSMQKWYSTKQCLSYESFSFPMNLVKKDKFRCTSFMLNKQEASNSISLIRNNSTPKKLSKKYRAEANKRAATLFIARAYITKNMLKHRLNEALPRPLNKYGRNNQSELKDYTYNFFKLRKTFYGSEYKDH
eukprot:TRINITY_DN9344_c0_g2_i1.p1 TRINITY_DN9344_c0_g2~~TRINITY_DN9344_c0_g2_i1.p1  ORF type:complete len:143 (+),score=19.08 TRINITY_DN9344_c0_g2_i1:289-717(+)